MLYDCGPIIDDRGICAVDPCDANICYPSPRVVIVGAGMAGLSAAARLSQRGINNIVVLEAYERFLWNKYYDCIKGEVYYFLKSPFITDQVEESIPAGLEILLQNSELTGNQTTILLIQSIR